MARSSPIVHWRSLLNSSSPDRISSLKFLTDIKKTPDVEEVGRVQPLDGLEAGQAPDDEDMAGVEADHTTLLQRPGQLRAPHPVPSLRTPDLSRGQSGASLVPASQHHHRGRADIN